MISQACQNLIEELNFYDQSQFLTTPSSFSKEQATQHCLQKPKQNQISFEHTKEFDDLHQYVLSQHCSPLLINSEPFCGKKVFLSQYINHCSKHKKNLIFLSHFSCANKVYSQILYKIMVKLRMLFNIKQKVQLSQQKIRRFFKYWLQVTSQIIQRQNIGYGSKQKKIVVIIIDGVDLFTDMQGKNVNTQFWLPKQMPKNIKLILTQNNSKEQKKNKQIMKCNMTFFPEQIIKEVKNIYKQEEIAGLNLNLYQLKIVYFFKFLNKNFVLNKDNHKNFRDILEDYIECCSQRSLTQKEIKSLLFCLTLTKKGLSQEELSKIIKLKVQSIKHFIILFQPLISTYKEYHRIVSPHLKQLIQEICDPVKQKGKTYHQIIAKVLKKQNCSIRKLEQEIYHLQQAEMYLEIKEILSQIQNFLVLFNPFSKFFLCLMWSKVQKHLNSDPVFEYNKGIQFFLNHYYLKQQDLYKIIFQLSMFFKQYSQFQNFKTPQFRHSMIRGDTQQLQKISVFGQMNQMRLISAKRIKNKQKIVEVQVINQKQKNKNLSIERQNTLKKSQQARFSLQNELQSEHKIPLSEKQEVSIQFSIQQMNVSTNLNKNKFKQYFLKKLEPYLKQFYTPYKKISNNDVFLKTSVNQDDQQQQITDLNLQTISLKTAQHQLILKQLEEYLEQNYHRQENRKYYYYNIWLWVQFPWICQSLNFNFSQEINNFIGCNTAYMSIDQQILLVNESLKISKISKQNKSAIYQHKPIQLSSIKKGKQNNNQKSILCRKSVDISPSKTKQYNFAKYNLNLSLIDQKLSKQLEVQISHRKMYDSRVLRQLQNKKQISSFLTQAEPNFNKKQINLKLPKLQNSRQNLKIIKNDLQKQNQIKLINSINLVKDKNKQIANKIEQIQKSSIMFDNIDQNLEISAIKSQIQKLQNKKRHVLADNLIQQNLKLKLETIIKICDNNKRHQSQTEQLNKYLESLKKMNQIQSFQSKNMKKQMLQIIKNLKKQIQQLKLKRIKSQQYLQEKEKKSFLELNQSKQLQRQEQSKQNEKKRVTQKYKLNSTYSKNTELRKKKKLKSTKKIQNSFKIQDYSIFQNLFSDILKKEEATKVLQNYEQKILKLNQINLSTQELEYQKQQKIQQLQNLKSQIMMIQKKQVNEKSSYLQKQLREKQANLQIKLQRMTILKQIIKMIS